MIQVVCDKCGEIVDGTYWILDGRMKRAGLPDAVFTLGDGKWDAVRHLCDKHMRELDRWLSDPDTEVVGHAKLEI